MSQGDGAALPLDVDMSQISRMNIAATTWQTLSMRGQLVNEIVQGRAKCSKIELERLIKDLELEMQLVEQLKQTQLNVPSPVTVPSESNPAVGSEPEKDTNPRQRSLEMQLVEQLKQTQLNVPSPVTVPSESNPAVGSEPEKDTNPRQRSKTRLKNQELSNSSISNDSSDTSDPSEGSCEKTSEGDVGKAEKDATGTEEQGDAEAEMLAQDISAAVSQFLNEGWNCMVEEAEEEEEQVDEIQYQ
eukprot:TRINITY_DN4065_c0_g1_i2.p1 TRINITY_DN4065_c0_g1~~TRINITY_DN4065_c0_g1_i2.p1  ORF type:complete len:244 (+),score=73.15 TRINITY_DN4065_c0_g1_i2:84-815(+)